MTRQEITALIVTGLLLVSTFAISVLWVPQRSEAEPEPLRTHIRGIIQLDRSSNSGALLGSALLLLALGALLMLGIGLWSFTRTKDRFILYI